MPICQNKYRVVNYLWLDLKTPNQAHTHTHTAENTHAQINNKSHSSKREEEALSEAFIVHWDGKYEIWTRIHTQVLTNTFISFAVSFLLMIYKADTSQWPRSLNRKEKRGQTANVWGTRPSVCRTQSQSGSVLIWQWAKMHISPLFLCSSPFLPLPLFFFSAQKQTLGCSLSPLQPRFPAFHNSIISTIELLLMIHFNRSVRGEKHKKKCLGVWQPPHFLRVGEWRTVRGGSCISSPWSQFRHASDGSFRTDVM